MLQATKKWLFQKISSVIMVPFMIWFLMNIVTIFNGSYDEVINFFTSQPSKILFSILAMFLISCGGGSSSDKYEGEPADHAGHGIWKIEIREN